MSDSVERMVNLALYLASSRAPRSAEDCRAAGLGYPADQDDAAFIRMFERDKDALRAAGLVIDVVDAGDSDVYRIDAEATYARALELSTAERASLRAVATAFVDDPGFPFGDALRSATAKLGTSGESGPIASAELGRTAPAGQGGTARAIAEAVQARKTVTFEYTNASGETRARAVDPYGVFFRDGSWYLVGRDRNLDEVRTFAIPRMSAIDVNPVRPRTPDFERPVDFDIRLAERLPFQYGVTPFTARIRFLPETAWRIDRLARGHGTSQALPDGSAVWVVEASDVRRLASWIIDEGPGLYAVEPEEVVDAVLVGLRKVAEAHA
ncbi:MAG: WYL domain-containing protein [Coriobacteriia bacterium]|nr:WYL domain-containing protein [Coriobacteriia bacterium]